MYIDWWQDENNAWRGYHNGKCVAMVIHRNVAVKKEQWNRYVLKKNKTEEDAKLFAESEYCIYIESREFI